VVNTGNDGTPDIFLNFQKYAGKQVVKATAFGWLFMLSK
jgi:hypothetical protein